MIIQSLETVIYVTLKIDPTGERDWPVMNLIEIYPFGRAFGGQYLKVWRLGEDEKIPRWCSVGFDGQTLVKLILKGLFNKSFELGFDPNGIDRVTCYQEGMKNEVVRLFRWQRGQPLEKNLYELDPFL